MCKKSESIKEIAIALAKFNMKVQRIEKDSANPHFKNRYASLDGILDEVRPLLAEQGLSILQMPSGDGENFKLTTMLIHISGEWIESDSLAMRPTKNDPQGIGSATTYARRYGVSSFLGLSTGEIDDDGNAASQQPRQQPQNAPQQSNSNNQPASKPQASKPAYTPPHAYKRDAYALREELFMTWNDLQSFAERVLNRKLGKVTEIQDEKDWEIIVRELRTYQSQPAGG